MIDLRSLADKLQAKLTGLEISPSWNKADLGNIDALFVKSYLQEHSSDEM